MFKIIAFVYQLPLLAPTTPQNSPSQPSTATCTQPMMSAVSSTDPAKPTASMSLPIPGTTVALIIPNNNMGQTMHSLFILANHFTLVHYLVKMTRIKSLKIATVNLNGGPYSETLILRAKELKYDIICVSELPINYKFLNSTAFVSFYAKNPRAALIILNKSITGYPDIVTSTFVSVTLKYVKIKIASIYIPIVGPKDNYSETEQTVINYINNNVDKTLVTGDFNAHLSILGDPTSDNRGKKLLDNINRSMWAIINSPGTPTYKATARSMATTIDWTIVSQDLIDKCEWKLEQDTILDLSDHFCMQTTIKLVHHFNSTQLREFLQSGLSSEQSPASISYHQSPINKFFQSYPKRKEPSSPKQKDQTTGTLTCNT